MTTLDTANPTTEVVVEGPGWRQVTGPTSRHYEIVGHDGVKFRSMSGLPWCDDFSGAARWMAGSWVAAHMLDLQRTDQADIRATVAHGAEAELDAAARRGTAVHGYMEALDCGAAINWDEIHASGASAWIAAADAYRASRDDVDERWCEVVCFNPDQGVAGTIDYVERRGDRYTIGDYKTRTSRHDRRTKEAAQAGGYADAISAGGFIDSQGRRHVVPLEAVSHVEIVTFCPDGSYAVHRVDTRRAVELHRLRLPLAAVAVANTYDKAAVGDRDINADLQARLDTLAPDTKAHLAELWRQHGMPKIADIGVDEYALAVQLFETVEPFRTPTRTGTPADVAEVAALIVRWRMMPRDIADEVQQLATDAGGGSLSATIVDEAQVAIWNDWIGAGEWRRDTRHDEIATVLDVDKHPQLVETLGPWAEWDEHTLELAYLMVDAADKNGDDLIGRHGGKRNAVTAAKTAAEAWGLPRPTKFSDIADDPRLFAATWATDTDK